MGQTDMKPHRNPNVRAYRTQNMWVFILRTGLSEFGQLSYRVFRGPTRAECMRQIADAAIEAR